MSTRRYKSGYSKLQQKEKRVKVFVKSRKGIMDKFIKINQKMN